MKMLLVPVIPDVPGLNELVPVRPVAGLEGDFIFHQDQVVSAIERERPAEIYCSGIQVVNPAAINALTRFEGDFYSVWRQLIEVRQLKVSSVYPKRWFSVDTVEQLMMLNNPAPDASETALRRTAAAQMKE